MRLKQLKLAGFKSFVDPTLISLTSNLSAVVGPNGCGKSNIIDAVRWVLGESSAKNLRGEGMTDVIFNGSNARKPVSQASVELTFTNDQNKIQGAWQAYSEIAIKRMVNRDGQSDYYINNQKCRRRDITDLLSGTGLGPRSYAIIEQGTISRLVESKPQELRVFIEEAAGITKYKERRRETENRIKHSRENLSRLGDLKFELDTQVENLESQAQDAQQYTQLKSQERQLNQDIIVLRWKNFQLELEQAQQKLLTNTQQLNELEFRLNDKTSDTERIETQIKLLNSQRAELVEQSYQCEANVSQTSSQLNLLAKLQQQQQQQQEKLQLTQQTNLSRMQQQAQRVAAVNHDVEKLLPQLPIVTEQLLLLNDQCRVTEQRLEQAQQQLSLATNHQSSVQQQLELAQHSHRKISQDQLKLHSQQELLKEKLRGFGHENQALTPTNTSDHYQLLRQQHQDSLAKLVVLDGQTKQTVKLLETHDQERQAIDVAMVKVQNTITTCEMLSQSKLKVIDDAVVSQYSQSKQLWQQIEVVAKWQHSTEIILGQFLQAYCVDELVEDMPQHQHIVIEKKQSSVINNGNLGTKRYPLLSNFVTSDYAIDTLLAGIYCASDIEQAKVIARQLSLGESVITQQGQCFGPGFIAIHGGDDANDSELGLIELQQKSVTAAQQLAQYEQQRLQHQKNGDVLYQLKEHQQAECAQLQVISNEDQEKAIEAKQQWLLEQQRRQHINDQQLDLNRQINELEKIQQLEQQQVSQLDIELTTLVSQQKSNSTIVAEHQDSVDNLKQQLTTQREHYQHQQHHKHDAELALQKQQLQLNAAEHQLQQLNEIVADNQQQVELLSDELVAGSEPIKQQTDALASQQHQLIASQSSLQQLDKTISAVITEQQQAHSSSKQGQLKLSQLETENNRVNLSCETLKVKLNAQAQALEMSQREIAEFAYGLIIDSQSKQWPQHLSDVKQKLANIGPINLTAINQYNEQKQRSDHLTLQIDDLEQALATLELAIKKIDRESRDKFKLTFDAVNHDFKQLFPKVFGGGSAQLTLTDSDLLSSGVSIMAQPPGKKNSTIHLLSGGEKALTALSLVFAIFQLNPAPFCMLDEVDAPLDDANVERYCNLVKEMSETVQFIFITHNKVSMEMAEHLTGITMMEAGVSRVVAVDVAQAMSLVED